MESGTEEYLLSVWGTSDENIYIVGDKGVVLRWDGSQWNRMEPCREEYFAKVRGLGPDHVYAVGENGCVIKFDGNKWVDMSL